MQETVFRKNIEVKKEMELLYRGIRYKLGYGIDNAGKSFCKQTISIFKS